MLELGHERNGHLGAEKVSTMISRYFVWPEMAKDIMNHCGSCRVCQVRTKHKPRRAPVVVEVLEKMDHNPSHTALAVMPLRGTASGHLVAKHTYVNRY